VASFTLFREVNAPPEVVFDVLTDHRRYAELTPLRKSELEREGEPGPNGVGSIRVLTAVGPPMREETIAYERPTRFSYKVLSGLPVRDHVGTVSLEPAGDGTKVTYAVRTTPTLPVGGGIVVAAVKRGIKQLLNGVSSESERRGGVAGPDGPTVRGGRAAATRDRRRSRGGWGVW
jgi:uncharacterized protein YndB with AHSA1/START domain